MYEYLEDWPDCLVPGCPNKCCLALNSNLCYPHTKRLVLNSMVSQLDLEVQEEVLDELNLKIRLIPP